MGVAETAQLDLSQVAVGERVQVTALVGEREVRWRLMDLGLVAGTRVEVVRRSPLGDPVVYRFRGTTVALRRADAQAIQVIRSQGGGEER